MINKQNRPPPDQGTHATARHENVCVWGVDVGVDVDNGRTCPCPSDPGLRFVQVRPRRSIIKIYMRDHYLAGERSSNHLDNRD